MVLMEITTELAVNHDIYFDTQNELRIQLMINKPSRIISYFFFCIDYKKFIYSLSSIIFLLPLFIVSRDNNVQAKSGVIDITINSLSPTFTYNWQNTEVVLEGSGFVDSLEVFLNDISIEEITYIHDTEIVISVPPNLPVGDYNITVINPDNSSTTLSNAFTIYAGGDGNIGNWEESSPLTGHLYRQNAILNGNDIYAIGTGIPQGNGRFDERATIFENGSLSSWSVINESGFVAGSGSNTARRNNDIYAASGGVVEHTRINPDGSLDTWIPIRNLNIYRSNPALVVGSDYLYVIGGLSIDVNPLKTVERAKINDDGSLGLMEYTSSLNSVRIRPGAVSIGNFIYVAGGHSGVISGITYSSVEMTIINSDGSLQPWTYVTSLSSPMYSPAMSISRGYLYACDRYSIEKTQINSEGMLSTWINISMPVRYYPSLLITQNFLYALGGFSDSYASESNAVRVVNYARLSPLYVDELSFNLYAKVDIEFEILGKNFLPGVQVYLGTIPITTRFFSTEKIYISIPSSFGAGFYNMVVENPDDQIIELPGAILISNYINLPILFR